MKNCKVKCVKCKTDDRMFIVGKTYKVDENGYITGEEGFKFSADKFNLSSHFLNDYYEFEIVDDLRDKIFQTHNEISIRDGRVLCVLNDKVFDYDGKHISSKKDYDSNLIAKTVISREYDIMKVYNPITKEVIYDRNFVDWSKVKVDTPILVSYNKMGWTRGYFAKYEDGVIYAFGDGKTSWSASDDEPWGWKYAKLAEGENE